MGSVINGELLRICFVEYSDLRYFFKNESVADKAQGAV